VGRAKDLSAPRYVDIREVSAGGPDILNRILGYFKNSAIETVVWGRLWSFK